jgi:MFS family permease
VSLWRNRDFVLLELGQLLSTAGTQATTIAYPLLVLATTHSPAKAGLVTFARLVPYALFGLVAGVAADRWNRKWLMVAADAVRALALASLGAAIAFGGTAFWPVLVAAFVEGSGSVLFNAAAAGALRAVVPRSRLPAAVAAQQGRGSVVTLAGPPLGGALFGLGQAVPFLVDAISYVSSTASLLAMRAAFQEPREREVARLRAQIAAGVRFLWSDAFLRTCTLLYGLANFIGPGLLLLLVVVGTRQGLSSTEIGVLAAAFGAATLAGSLVSPLVRRLLSVRAILLLELWLWPASVAFVFRPSVYVLTVALVVVGLAIPITDSVVVALRVARTPDRLLGRVESVRGTISRAIAPLGPLVAGLLVDAVSARAAVAVFAAFGGVLALWGTISPALRDAPSLAELEAPLR